MTDKPRKKGASRRQGKPVRSHFGITVGGVSIAYCYIRKNACSAWKRLFIEEATAPFDRSEGREIAFMAAHHGLRTIPEIDRHEHRVVVVRDPVERYVSAFVSLMIAHTPPPTRSLRKRGSKAFGMPVEEASFELFLEHQMPVAGGRRGRLDKHFWPQAWHLAPVTYTDVIDIERLAPAMRAMLGDALGARYFDRPVNATAIAPTYHDPEAPMLPANVLHARYRETGQLPDKASFLGEGRDAIIRAAYAEDDALYRACKAHDAANPTVPMTLRVDASAKVGKPRDGRKRGTRSK
jgi:hypothetical protein